MKILMVLEGEFPPDTRVENEISALIVAGHQVEIACFTKQNRPSFEVINNLTIHRKKIPELIHKTSVGSLKFPFYFNFWRKFLNQLIIKYSYDAIHIHDLPLSLVGYEFKKKYGLKLTIDLHENWPGLLKISTHTNTILGKLLSSNRQWMNYEKNILKKADNVIVVVEEAMNRIIDFGIDKRNIHIVSNTLNTKEFKAFNKIPDPKYFTLYYAGYINKHRGLQIAIDAVNIISKSVPNIRLWIAGKGSYQIELEKKVKDLNIEQNVTFFGWKPLTEVSKLLSQSNVALIPHLRSSHTDATIPHKIFQYMFIEKPIIASDCIPIKRIIEETKSGLIYKDTDAKALANAVITLIKNGSATIDTKLGKETVINKYNWDFDKNRLISIYS